MSGFAEKKSIRLRQCIVSRENLDPDKLMRFVLGPDDTVTLDLKRQLPGRGVWVKAQADYIASAVKKDLFRKAFRKKVNIAPHFVEHIYDLLKRAALQRLAFANKAGTVICGFEKITKAIETKDIIALIHALEAAESGAQKIQKKWLHIKDKELTHDDVITCFSSEDLSIILGRDNVVHAALENSSVSLKFLQDVVYLNRYSDAMD